MFATIWLLRRQWRSRIARWLLVVGVVAIAVTPLISVVVEQHSADAANLELGRTLAGGAPLRVVGSTTKGGLTPETVARLGALDGVASVVPMTQAITVADGTTRPVIVLGVDCSAEAILGKFGCSDAIFGGSTAPVFVAPRLLGLVPDGGALRSTAGGVPRAELIASDRLSRINDGFVALTGAERARQLFARGANVDVAYLVPEPSITPATLSVEIAAMGGPELRVLGPNDPPPGPDVAGQISALLGVVGLFGLVVGWLLVRNITRLALAERSRELAIAIAMGRPPSAVVVDLSTEAVLLGVLGAGLGCLGGFAGGSVLVGSLRELVGRFTGTTMAVQFPGWAIPIALIIALGMVMAATLPEARRAARADVALMLPAQQAGFEPDARRSWWPTFASLVLLIGSIVGARLVVGKTGLAVWGQPVALVMLLGAIVGGFGVAGGTVPLAMSALARMTRRLPRFAVLTRSIAGQGRRVTSVSLAVTFSVALATVLGGLVPAMRSSAFDYTERNIGERLAINTLPFNDSSLVDAKIGPNLIDRIGEVAGSPTSRETFVLTRARPGVEVGVMASEQPHFGFSIISGPPAAAVLNAGRGIIGAPLARVLGIGVGDRLVLDAPAGPAPITVGAISENINNAGLVVMVPAAFVVDHWGWQPPDPLLVGHVDGPAISDRTTAQIAALDPHLRIETASELASETSDAIAGYLGPFEMLRDILLGVVAIAAFTALMLAASQRRREFALLNAIGLAPNELRKMALVEATIVAVVGAVQGMVIGLILAEPLRDAASFVVGIRPPLRVGLIAAAAACVSAVTASLVASLGPAQRLKRLDTSAALRGE